MELHGSIANHFYQGNTSLHSLVKDMGKDADPVQVKAQEEAEAHASGGVRNFFSPLIGKAELTPEEKRAQALGKNRENVERFERKLIKLEQRAANIESRLLSASDDKAKLAFKQELLALRELMVEVKIAISEGVLEEYDLMYPEGSDDRPKFEAVREKVTELQSNLSDEGKMVLRDEEQFWGLRKVYEEIQDSRWAKEDHEIADPDDPMGMGSIIEERDPDIARSVDKARESLVKEFGLQGLRSLVDDLEGRDAEVHHRRELKAEVKVLKDATLHGHLPGTSFVLDEDEIRALKEEQFKEAQEYQETRAEILAGDVAEVEARLEELERDLDPIEDKLWKKLNIEWMIDPEVDPVSAEQQRVIDKLEAKMAPIKQEIEELTTQKAQLQEKIAEAKAEGQRMEDNLVAQKDVDRLLSGEASSVQGWTGKIFGAAANYLVSAAVGDKSHTYDWEHSEWGQLISDESGLNPLKNFRDTVAAMQTDMVGLDAKIRMMHENRLELQTRIDDGRAYNDKFVDLYGGKGAAIEREWKAQIAQLDKAIESAENIRQDSEITLRAAFLKQISESTGTRVRAKKAAEAEVTSLQADIARLESAIEEKEQLVGTLTDSGKRALAGMKSELKELESQQRQHQGAVSRLSREIAQLNAGFREQMAIYETLEQPERAFMEHLASKTGEELTKIATLGFVSNIYQTPSQLEFQLWLANNGYSWSEAMTGFVDFEGGKAAWMETQMKDFFTFMDTYPDLAQDMSANLAVTFYRLGGQPALDTFKAGIRARAYTQAVTGQLMRSVKPKPELTPELFAQVSKWVALGQLAEKGPVLAGLADGVSDALKAAQSGGIVGAVVAGTTSAYKNAAMNVAIQEAVRSIQPEHLQASVAVTALLTGESPRDVVKEQAALTAVTIGSEAVQAIRSGPRGLFSGIREAFSKQFSAFKHASWPEKIVRFGAIVLPPLAGAGIAGGAIFLAATGPIGWGIAAAIAVVAIFAGFTGPFMVTGLLNLIPPFSTTNKKAARARARNLADGYDNQLKLERDKTIANLETQGLIIAPRTTKPPPQLEIWLQDSNNPINEAGESLLDRLRHDLDTKETGLNRDLATRDVIDVYTEIARPPALRELVKAAVEQAIIDEQKINPEFSVTRTHKKALVDAATVSLSQRLKREFLAESLDKSMKNELVTFITTHASTTQADFELQKRDKQKAINDAQEKYKRNLERAVGADLTNQGIDMAHKDRIVQELTMSAAA